MAIINKNSITFNDTKPFNGLAVNAPLVVDNGADGSFAVAAHQIYWGNTYFNGSYLSNGTTEALLSAIEDACAGFNAYYINDAIEDYINKNGSYFATDTELDAGLTTYYNKIMDDVSSNYTNNDDLQSMLGEKANTGDIPTKVSELTNDAGFITLNQVPEYDATTITDSSAKEQNQTYYISNIDVISLGNNDYKISYTFAELPSTEIVAASLWENYNG